MHTKNFGICPHSKKDNIQPFLRLMKENIPLLFPIRCERSVKQSGRMRFPPFPLAPLHKTAVMLLPLCGRLAAPFQHLLYNVLPAILFFFFFFCGSSA